MKPVEFYTSYGAMRHEELIREAEDLHKMRLLREANGSRLARLLVRAGRSVAEVGRSLEAAGRGWYRKPAHG